MNQLLRLALALFAFQQTATAENVGIEFSEMKIGTTLVTETLGSTPKILEQEYIGKQGDFFVIEERQLEKNGAAKSLGQVFYDTAGRRVKSVRQRGVTHQRPFSCMFALGTCTHVQDYPNSFAKNKEKRTKSTATYNNRLEGDIFILSWKLVDNSVQEVPHKLGPYNFRVSSEYKNRLGQVRGHKLLRLIEP